MAFSLTSVVLVSAVLYCVYSYISAAIAERKFQQFARDNGCSSPHIVTNKLPWGMERIYRILRTPYTGEDVFEDLITPRVVSSGYTDEGSGPFGKKGIMTAEPKNFQAVFATKFNDFEQGPVRHKQFGALLGQSIFNSDGALWQHSRSMIRPQFSRDQINDLDDTEDSTKLLLQAMPVGADGWVDMDIGPLFFKFTLDTATAFLFGNSVNSLKAAIPGVEAKQAQHEAELMAQRDSKTDMNFEEAVFVAQGYLSNRIRMQGLYWMADSPKFRRSVAYVQRFVDYYVQMALKGGDAEKSFSHAKKYNLLEALANECKDETELRDQILGRSKLVASV